MTIRPPDRRSLLRAGAALVGASLLAGCDRLDKMPWFRRTLEAGEDANLFVQRLLLKPAQLAPEYAESQISPWFKPNGTDDPPDSDYKASAKRRFSDWRLVVDGLVETPQSFSLADLRRMQARTQITRHDCVEGWSCIGKWTGVPVSDLLKLAVLKPNARYVVLHCADTMEGGEAEADDDDEEDDDEEAGSGGTDPNMTGPGAKPGQKGAAAPAPAAKAKPVRYYESIDLEDAYHPQTILAYEMNGQTLPIAHGAPLRLRLERQLGYKNAKYVRRLEVVEDYARFGQGKGGYWEDRGYDWYAGI